MGASGFHVYHMPRGSCDYFFPKWRNQHFSIWDGTSNKTFFFIIRCGGSLLSTNNSCRYWFLIFMVKQLLRTARLEILFLWLYCCKFLVAVLITKHSSWVRCLTRVYHLHDMYSLHPRVTPICWSTIMWACIYTKMNQKVLQQKVAPPATATTTDQFPLWRDNSGVPLTVYPWYLLCSLGILGDYNP